MTLKKFRHVTNTDIRCSTKMDPKINQNIKKRIFTYFRCHCNGYSNLVERLCNLHIQNKDMAQQNTPERKQKKTSETSKFIEISAISVTSFLILANTYHVIMLCV